MYQKQNIRKLPVHVISQSEWFHEHKLPSPHYNSYQNKFLLNRHEQDKDQSLANLLMEAFFCNRTLVTNVFIVVCKEFLFHEEIETMVFPFDHRPERDAAPVALKTSDHFYLQINKPLTFLQRTTHALLKVFSTRHTDFLQNASSFLNKFKHLWTFI